MIKVRGLDLAPNVPHERLHALLVGAFKPALSHQDEGSCQSRYPRIL